MPERRGWLLLFLALLAALLIVPLNATTPERTPCHWVRGRLMAYNGNPTFRIWPAGTHRLLGVVCLQRGCEGPSEFLPPVLLRFDPSFDRTLWGEFKVCPLQKERPGWMRMVLVTDARQVTVIDSRER